MAVSGFLQVTAKFSLFGRRESREEWKKRTFAAALYVQYCPGLISHVPGDGKQEVESKSRCVLFCTQRVVSWQHSHAGMSSYICKSAPWVTGRSLI